MKEMTFREMFPEFERSDEIANRLKHNISKAIYKKRKELGLSQKDFANLLDVTQGMVSKWENFDYNFTVEGLAKICDKLNLKLEISLHPVIEQYKQLSTSPFCKCNYSYDDKWKGVTNSKIAKLLGEAS